MCTCECCIGSENCATPNVTHYPATLFSAGGGPSACDRSHCARIFDECPEQDQPGSINAAYEAACPSSPPPGASPPPCSAYPGHHCDCKCCKEGECPNYSEIWYPAALMHNVGSSTVCTEGECRRLFEESCPAVGQGGRVISTSYLAVDCPPSPPMAPPPLCAQPGSTGIACNCNCCTDADCQTRATHSLLNDQDKSCTPNLCASSFAECSLTGSSSGDARIIATMSSVAPCPSPPTWAPQAPSVSANKPLPVWVAVLVAVLGAALLGTLMFVCFIRHRERQGEPVWTALDSIVAPDPAGGSSPPRVLPQVAAAKGSDEIELQSTSTCAGSSASPSSSNRSNTSAMSGAERPRPQVV